MLSASRCFNYTKHCLGHCRQLSTVSEFTQNHLLLNHSATVKYASTYQFSTTSTLSADASKDAVNENIRDKNQLALERKEVKRLAKLEKQRAIIERIKAKEVNQKQQAVIYEGKTSLGEKKDTNLPLPEAYSPAYVEAVWYDWWVKQGFFTPEYALNNKKNKKEESVKKKTFTTCLPPPNVTGTLHLGHGLGNSIQDAIVRWHRMNGDVTLWNPGSDHAGISTQVVVEKRLWRELGKSRHDLGREAFIEQVWRWKNEKGGQILEQMRRLGSSLDWSRDCFTLDPKLCRAVNEAFIRLFDEGIIYRSRRLVNWSCALKSAISDIEVENLALDGKTYLQVSGYDNKIPFGLMYTFSYPIIDSDELVTVATTRPETLLGDTGVAVHPNDQRYAHLHGKCALNPFTQRVMPIVCSTAVDRNLGTGAVKLTPAHDPTDYSIATEHNLPFYNIISDEGLLIDVPQPFQNMKRFEGRTAIIEALKSLNLYKGSVDHAMVLPRCSRSGDVVEFLMKDQWYVKCEDMAKKANEAVSSGRLKLVPSNYEKIWHEWMNNCRDWCISRQLWWGHRIPAYCITSTPQQVDNYAKELWIAAHSMDEALDKACKMLQVSKTDLKARQDEDVLDTWFSSSIFPFSIFGWPDQTEDLARFYPTNLLETASDIMFFWVARMVMMGEKLTGTLPFDKVLFHSILRDAHGRKMSKSLGNVVDPMDVIEGISLEDLQSKLENSNLDKSELDRAREGQRKSFPLGIPECGADALRFALCSYNFSGQFVNVDITHIKSARHFCNKLWQAHRYVLSNLGSEFQPSSHLPTALDQQTATDRWILSRLSDTVRSCNELFTQHRLYDVTKCLHSFWLQDFCDVYLEYSKPILKNGNTAGAPVADDADCVRDILYWCCEASLRLLSPFMPFLTEELYQRLPHSDNKALSVCVAEYPRYPEQYDMYSGNLESEMNTVRDISSHLLAVRRDLALTKTRATVYINTQYDNIRQAVTNHRLALETISRSASVSLLENTSTTQQRSNLVGCLPVSSNSEWTAYVQLEGLVDKSKEMVRLKEELNKLNTEVIRLEQQLANCSVPERCLLDEEKLKSTTANRERLQRITDALEATTL